jgi:hypothetical protein
MPASAPVSNQLLSISAADHTSPLSFSPIGHWFSAPMRRAKTKPLDRQRDCLANNPRDLGTSDAVLGTGSLFAALDVDPTQLPKRPS